MRLSFLIFSLSCHHVLQLALANEITLTRHADGDVFTIPGSCNEACMVISSDTASPFGSAPSTFLNNDSCTCQCNYGLPVFREDLRICVDNIQECDVAGFISSSGLVEKVPYVILPVENGQIVYPDGEIYFEGVKSPVCVISGVQQLGKSGWSELRNIPDVKFPLSLSRVQDSTFLQWTGDAKLREAAEGKIVVVKLACRDSYPAYRGVFTTCVAFRVAGSPMRSASIKEVTFSTSSSSREGLTSGVYTAIGVSSLLFALIYVTSAALYLHVRKSRRKRAAEDERPESGPLGGCPSDNEATAGLVKCNPLLSVSRHFESDTNSAISEADLGDKLLQSESEPEVENVTSAIIHPHDDFVDFQEQICNSGSIIGERLPEEDVRIIETTENGNLHNMPIFPGTQRRKLYFNPAYFERQLLLVPPPAAIEFLLKIREVISIAKHKMAAKRFVPTLSEIPEELPVERASQGRLHAGRRRAASVQNGVLNSFTTAKSLKCSGCPGCNHGSSTPNLAAARGLVEASAISGESRVRAWLEDVKLLDTRWRILEEERAISHRQQQQPRPTKHRDSDLESTRLSCKSLPPMFQEVSQGKLRGCVNEVFEDDECHRAERRTTRSVTREPGYLERNAQEAARWSRWNGREHAESHANATVRRAIEDSFKSQLEQLRSERPKSNDSNFKNSEKVNGRPPMTDNHVKQVTKKSPDIQETRALLNIINGELSVRSTTDAKRIMDAVIQELAVAKEKEKGKDSDVGTKASDYETDSLEKTKVNRRFSSSPVSTVKSSPTQSSALPLDEELTMRNAMIDVEIRETTKSNRVIKHNLPEVVPLSPENYALVSEVYVNDGYASPTGSDDDSGPEIQYEAENPGHLTIKVIDSPKNYIKQDESEYEPDTLDRKPMKLKINGDVSYNKDIVHEVYVDSLERSPQILLRTKGSFKEENGIDMQVKPPREYNSLREIYEARLKYQQQQQQPKPLKQEKLPEKLQPQLPVVKTVNGQLKNWQTKNCKCTSPLLPRHERRQRKADNQPDVVPKPPPSPEQEPTEQAGTKNAEDRSLDKTGDPTTCEDAPDAPVIKEAVPVVGKPPTIGRKPHTVGGSSERTNKITLPRDVDKKIDDKKAEENPESMTSEAFDTSELTNADDERRSEKRQQYRRFSKWRGANPVTAGECSGGRRSRSVDKSRERRSSRSRSRSKSRRSRSSDKPGPRPVPNLEDSAYVSSPESNCSRRQLLLQREPRPSWSCSESDESTCNGHGANSESGAESIETDSVFFGNFRAREERERLAAANRRQSLRPGSSEQPHQPRPLNYQAFRIKSRVY